MSSDIYPEGLALRHWPGWLDAHKANAYLEQLLKEVPWKQEQIKLFGRQHPLPRLTCWMADPGCGYCYSGLQNVVESWTPTAQTIREQVTKAAASPF
ncbi:MAG: alpha-ketoglutarate-dependent dioxygenase AlkB, partial [Synechococcaceae bacterium WBA_3_309]|nr:alpha-ketoglutarate-dependent dioxygenase AlkB [Synechococcaceae bacterium WBA_3_309]